MGNLKKSITLQRVISAGTLGVLLIALQATGVLGTFYRGLSSINTSNNTYTSTGIYGYGYGWNDDGSGYSYGYGPTYTVAPITTSTSGSSSGGGGGSISTPAVSDDVTSGNSSSSSNSTGGGSTSSTISCKNTDLICKKTGEDDVYKLFRKSGKTCQGGNLGKVCIPSDGTTTDTTTTDGTTTDTTTTDGTTTDGTTTQEENTACNSNLNVAYSDTANNWAVKYINDLSSKGIMNGNTSGLLNPVGVFEPWRNTTRTEFLKIALRAYCYEYINENTSSLSFIDVNKSSWQARVIKKGISLGVVSTSNSTFRPNDTISRIEAIKMLLRVAETRNNVYSVDSSVTTTSFSDISASWQAKYAEKAKQLNIISNNSTFKPNAGIKRDETAKIVYKSRILNY